MSMDVPWLKLWKEAIDDVKILEMPPAMRWHWVVVLVASSDTDGTLPTTARLAIKLRVSEKKAGEIVEELIKRELVDLGNDAGSVLKIHNWKGRQDKIDHTHAARQKRYRARQRDGESDGESDVTRDAKSNGSEPSRVTSPGTPILEEEVEEEKETREPRLFDWSKPAFDQFWQAYPHKVGKAAALKAFVRAGRTGVDLKRLMFAVERYKTEKRPDVPFCNPATWLNQGRWDDQPANGGSSSPNIPGIL